MVVVVVERKLNSFYSNAENEVGGLCKPQRQETHFTEDS